jgi:hypothetical protein
MGNSDRPRTGNEDYDYGFYCAICRSSWTGDGDEHHADTCRVGHLVSKNAALVQENERLRLQVIVCHETMTPDEEYQRVLTENERLRQSLDAAEKWKNRFLHLVGEMFSDNAVRTAMPVFEFRHRWGRDVREFTEGIDAAIDAVSRRSDAPGEQTNG